MNIGNKKKKNLALKKGSPSQRTGAIGERRARVYLILHGYRILEKNALYGHKEIDIIARKGSTYAFIEVKARTHTDIAPALSVTSAKRRRVITAANSYAAAKGIHNACLRYDIIEVDLSEKLPLKGIRHIINAYN